MKDALDAAIAKQQARSIEEKKTDFFRIFEYLVNSAGIRGKTRLTKAQRNMIYVYDLMHRKHPDWGLAAAAENIAVLLVSDDGKSREEMIALFHGALQTFRQTPPDGEEADGRNQPGIKGNRF